MGRTASPSDDEEIDRRAKYDTDSEEFDDEEDDKRKKKKKIDYMYWLKVHGPIYKNLIVYFIWRIIIPKM